jgi:protein-S-isoprenylcysteine O-methyltransferase Ste14
VIDGLAKKSDASRHDPLCILKDVEDAAHSAMKSLRARAWFALAVVTGVMGLLLFVPAGTVDYWEAWVFLSLFAGGSVLVTLDVMKNNPALLERRMSGGPTAEKRPVQQLIMLVACVCFVAVLVVPALDRRFGWSAVPPGIAIAGDVLFVIGFAVVFLVYRENSFASATIEVAENQKVISTGPYAIVRHPMYAGSLVYVLGMPLALGSYWGLIPVAAMAPFLIWRLLDEERFLANDLAGYSEYQKKVRHRLLPFVW